MRSFRGLPLFLFLTACLVMGLALSCSGIGGGKAVPYDSVYGNGTSGGSSGGSSGSSGDGSSTGVFVPIGITPFINPDNIDAFIQLFQSGGDEGGSSPIVLDPDDLGLPDGGFVTLTMNWAGGSYTRTVQKNADGRVMFDGIPSIADGTQVSVDLTVENAGHEKVWEGSGTGEVKDGLCNVDVKLKRYLPLSELADYIANLSTNTPTTPHRLPPISGLTAAGMATLKAVLQNNTNQYVDLSATTLPTGITDLSDAFNNCQKLAVAPKIPEGVTDMTGCFSGCYYLTTAPVIPASVTNMSNCFQGISSLTGNVIIKANITNPSNISSVFNYGYWSSLSVYVISGAVKDYFLADYNNQSLFGPPGSGKQGIIYDHLP